ncbi:MAG TPA: alpha/beta hydrolase-fold protein [Gemmatimonadales bacterium]|nr:alpha/beta hydrolase-fold protein [Gemmatimonadales bacterium]
MHAGRLILLALAVTCLQPVPARAQAHIANRAVFLDSAGVVRWRDDKREVTLFGANYVLPTASDYRAAGYLHLDRKQMIDEDLAQFARMGWDGMRLTFWGDWEASDSAGNLIANDHLDLQDYLIAKARERGIYLLFSPIQLYGANWPDDLANNSDPGFGRVFGKGKMGTDPTAIAAQVNYLKQILDHVNPYTHTALKDEPAIVFIELVNEPWHHPEDMPGSVRYINALTDAVRSTGCTKLIFYNVSQDFRIGPAIAESKAQGLTFGWYPTGLNSGHELEGNYLRGADVYPDMLRPALARLPRIVYEFDSPDLRSGTMYPAMTRTFRAVGTQMALMFAYDMQGTASRNLGWQTHYLSLAYTPRKAMSAIIAAEAMRRLPRMKAYGPYPGNTTFGDFHVSADSNLGQLNSADAFLYAGSTRSAPKDPAALRRIAGYGSSPVVTYDGEGVYFLDQVRAGVWRLEVYSDAVPVRDPFEPMSPDKIVTRAISRAWPMTVTLPDLGAGFTVQPLTTGNPRSETAAAGRFTVTPGVYVLSATGPLDRAALPAWIGGLGFTEVHLPKEDDAPLSVQSLAAPEYVTGSPARIVARVADRTPPDSVKLFLRMVAADFYHGYKMAPAHGYEYAATVPAADLKEGPHDFVITAYRGGSAVTFPEGIPHQPWDWNWSGRDAWKLDVVSARAPLALFTPRTDAARLSFTRIGDAGRRGLFRMGVSPVTGLPVFHLERPVDQNGWSPPDYTASLVIKNRIGSRKEAISAADALQLRLRGLGARQTLHVTLMEDDGTSWTAPVVLDSTWADRSLPLSTFTAGRGVLLPQGFPGEWNYWVDAAAGRGGDGDHLRPEHLERIQLSLRAEPGVTVTPGSYGVEVETVSLRFGGALPAASNQEAAAGQAQACCTATIRVRVPEGTGPLYLTGNLPELGWRPDALRMDGSGTGRIVRVTAPAGTEFKYKFTLGGWDREALNADGTVPADSRLILTSDTVVSHLIPAFKGGQTDFLADWKNSGVLGRLVIWKDVHSAFLGPNRHVEVWLPPGYDSSQTRYPVIYMADGQNLFDPRLSFTGVDWGVDEAMVDLTRKGTITPAIVVGVWNSPERTVEYSPWAGASRYARFLVEELMPRVNREFRTRTGPVNTFSMGSSMGGLLSFYLVTHHPEAFGGCGCESTHFPLSDAVMASITPGSAASATRDTVPYVVKDIAAGLTAPKGARYWFAFGSLGLDSAYAPTHEVVQRWLLQQGKVEGRDFVVRRYEGATHNEASWRARIGDDLRFLLAPRP